MAVEAAARRYRALAEPVRLQLLQQLEPRPRALSVGEIAALLGVSDGAASRHVTMLAMHGFVERTRNGMYVTCRLTAAGEAVVQRGLNAAGTVTFGPPSLADQDPEMVELYLALGASRYRIVEDRAEWDAYMEREFGTEVRQDLDVLRAAVERIVRQEPIGDLPLPPEVKEAYASSP